MVKLRFVIADDQHEVLDAVSSVLEEQFDIVATARSGESAIEAATRLNPDLVVLDISMPGMSGLEAASRLRESGSKAKVIFLTVHDDPDYVEAAFAAGGLGYVLKSRLGTDLLPAIQQVSQGGKFVSPPLHFNGHGKP